MSEAGGLPVTRRATVRLPLAVLLTVAAALIAVLAGRPEAALFAAPWTVMLILGLATVRTPSIRGTVELGHDRVMIGDDVAPTVVVQSDRAGWIDVVALPETGFRSDDDRPDARAMPAAEVIQRGHAPRIEYELIANEWGAFDVGRHRIVLHQAFGLMEWTTTLTEPQRVRVHPTPLELRELLAPWLVRRKSGVHESREVDRGVEFADLRLYQSDDSLRDINWRASARSDELWVSRRHPERATDVILFLDSLAETGHDVRSSVGLAIEAAVTLAESHLALSDRVGLIDIGGVLRWVAPGTGRLQLERLTDTLLSTRIYSNAAERRLAIVPPRALPPRSFVVALSPLLDSRFIDMLFVLRGAGHDVAVIECVPGEHRGDPAVPEPMGGVARLARRLVDAERTMMRDRLAERAIAVGRWQRGDDLDPVLTSIVAMRRYAKSAVR